MPTSDDPELDPVMSDEQEEKFYTEVEVVVKRLLFATTTQLIDAAAGLAKRHSLPITFVKERLIDGVVDAVTMGEPFQGGEDAPQTAT